MLNYGYALLGAGCMGAIDSNELNVHVGVPAREGHVEEQPGLRSSGTPPVPG